jgi:hypothetical protein
MIKDLKRIKRENQAYFNKLADVNISRERSPGILTNRKLESQHEKSRQLHRNTSKIHSRSPLHSGMKAPSLYYPSLRSSFQYQHPRGTTSHGTDPSKSFAVPDLIDGSLDSVTASLHRRLETARQQ